MTYGPPCPFRAVGYTWKAGLYPLSASGLVIIAEYNGVRVEQLPRGARNSSSRGMLDWIETLGAAKAEGRRYRDGNRMLTMRELAA